MNTTETTICGLDQLNFFNSFKNGHSTQSQKLYPLQIKEKQAKDQQNPGLGSMSVNGLDMEASWAVEQLLTTKDFDVSTSCKQILEK